METLFLLWLCVLLMVVCTEKVYNPPDGLHLFTPLLFAKPVAKKALVLISLLMIITALVTGFLIVEWYFALLAPLITAIIGRLSKNRLLNWPGFWFDFILSLGGFVTIMYLIISNK